MIEGAGYVYTEDVREQTIGVRVDEFARIIHHHYPKVGESPDAIVEDITARILEMPLEKIRPRPGAEEIIRFAAERNIPRAIASSSWECVIDRFIDLMSWDSLIPLRYSAQHMARGKPAPDIYLHAAEQLGIAPERCLALEDSRAGTQSALGSRHDLFYRARPVPFQSGGLSPASMSTFTKACTIYWQSSNRKAYSLEPKTDSGRN